MSFSHNRHTSSHCSAFLIQTSLKQLIKRRWHPVECIPLPRPNNHFKKPLFILLHQDFYLVLHQMEVFWKLVKGELRQQLVSYYEEFNVDLMHQWDQKVEQHTNTNRVTWAIVTRKSEDVSHSFSIYLPLLASPNLTSHPWIARIAVTLSVTCRCSHPIG